MSELEKLKRQNAELADRIAKLEEAAKPAEPFKSEWKGPVDYTEGMVMPKSARKAMIDALPSSFYSDLRADARKQNPVTGGPNPGPQPQVRRGSGWRDEIPLSTPPGVALADKLMDAQDEIDKVELALKLAKVELSKRE